MDKMYDKAAGSLVGMAVGNALGVSVRGETRGDLEPVTDMRGGVFNLAPGECADDVMMALVLAESLLACNGLDEKDFLQRLCEKQDDGAYRNIHPTLSRVLIDFKNLGTVMALAHKRNRFGRIISDGSITRIAPMAIFFNYDVKEAIAVAITQSKTTQPLAIYHNISQLMAFDLIMFYRGAPLEKMWVQESIPLTQDDVITTDDPQSLHDAAKWALKTTDNFRDAVLSVVNLGAEADVAGTIVGQYAGALYGLSGIPEEWIDQLIQKDYILELAEKLYYEED